MSAAVKNKIQWTSNPKIVNSKFRKNRNFLMEMYGKRQRAGVLDGRGRVLSAGRERQCGTVLILSTGQDGNVQRD